MPDYGIDRYEAQSIAESAAHNAASDAERNVGYEIDRVRDEIRTLRLDLEHERDTRRGERDEMYEGLEELRGLVGKLMAPALNSRAPE